MVPDPCADMGCICSAGLGCMELLPAGCSHSQDHSADGAAPDRGLPASVWAGRHQDPGSFPDGERILRAPFVGSSNATQRPPFRCTVGLLHQRKMDFFWTIRW